MHKIQDAEPSSSEYARARERLDSVPFWYHQIEVLPGLVTPGINHSALALEAIRLPDSLDGMRVLDIGARDGFYAFECERRGAAEVIAIDSVGPDKTGFAVAKELLGSKVEHTHANLYDLTPERFGEFDLILFLGVLYHLRDPMLALELIWDVCKEDLRLSTELLEHTFVKSDGGICSLADLHPELASARIAQFKRISAGEGDDAWVPTASCVRTMLEVIGFEIEFEQILGRRGFFGARKAATGEHVHRRRDEREVLTGDPTPGLPGAACRPS